MGLNRQIVGNTGLYYSSYMLSKLGYNVMITSRNARGADLIAVSDDEGRFFGVQVKSNSAQMDIRLSRNFSHPTVDFWIVIYDLFKEPDTFIIPAKDILDSYNRIVREEAFDNELVVYDNNAVKENRNYWIYKKYLLRDKELQKNDASLYYERWDNLSNPQHQREV